MSAAAEILEVVRGYILSEFLPDEDPARVLADTPLLSSGVLDSITVLRLVTHLEERYGVEFEPHELNEENLETIASITRLVVDKLPPS